VAAVRVTLARIRQKEAFRNSLARANAYAARLVENHRLTPRSLKRKLSKTKHKRSKLQSKPWSKPRRQHGRRRLGKKPLGKQPLSKKLLGKKLLGQN
jgi:hypothetical protein